jgi:hypothetical protein
MIIQQLHDHRVVLVNQVGSQSPVLRLECFGLRASHVMLHSLLVLRSVSKLGAPTDCCEPQNVNGNGK